MIYAVVAAFNEERTIKGVIDDLRSHGYTNIAVVDDGSADRTRAIAEEHGTHVVRHIINRGQGAALQTGIRFARRKGATIIITFDGDGQHQAVDIKRLIAPIRQDTADITLGSRFLQSKSNVPFIRKLFLKGGVLIIRVMYGLRLTDSHNGLRAMNAKAADAIRLTSDGMEHASEFIEEIRRNRLRFKEVPVTIKYTDYSRARGQSSLNAIRIFFRMVIQKLVR